MSHFMVRYEKIIIFIERIDVFGYIYLDIG